jgi:hypothetical protein
MGPWRASVLVVLAACGGKSAPAPDPGPDPETYVFAGDPIAAFGGLEEQLGTARRVEITTQIQSVGFFKADLTATYDVEREFKVSIAVEGTVAGDPVSAKWTSHDIRDDRDTDMQSPVWADAVLIGITRMGALHNLARILEKQDPDHGNGDVRTWVEVDQIVWKGDEPRTQTLEFDIIVSGIPSAEGELTLDTRGLPLRREQLVNFDGVAMRVVENYDRFELIP